MTAAGWAIVWAAIAYVNGFFYADAKTTVHRCTAPTAHVAVCTGHAYYPTHWCRLRYTVRRVGLEQRAPGGDPWVFESHCRLYRAKRERP